MDAGVCGFQRACGAACPDGGYKEKCRRVKAFHLAELLFPEKEKNPLI